MEKIERNCTDILHIFCWHDRTRRYNFHRRSHNLIAFGYYTITRAMKSGFKTIEGFESYCYKHESSSHGLESWYPPFQRILKLGTVSYWTFSLHNVYSGFCACKFQRISMNLAEILQMDFSINFSKNQTTQTS